MSAPETSPPTAANSRGKPLLLAALVVVVACAIWYRDSLDLDCLARHETALRDYQQHHPVAVICAAFVIYVAVTGLSLPGAAAMSLLYGWYFGFATGTVLVSFASTTGATLAMLLSRYLFRDAIQQRYAAKLQRFNSAWEREGPFCLFLLRLTPVVPFFLINVLMGLTPIRVWTFWWVSQVGMLPATLVYMYAGSRVPSLQRLADEGVQAVFTPAQLLQILSAFTLLGLFPLLVRWTLRLVAGRAASDLVKVQDDSADAGNPSEIDG